MTPEEAQALEPGTTAGPWEVKTGHGDDADAWIESSGAKYPDGEPRQICETTFVDNRADLELMAAAPDMRDTIAEMRWEYGVEDAYGVTAWMVCDYPEGAQDSETEAREHLSTFGPDSLARLVRRPVGRVEEAE